MTKVKIAINKTQKINAKILENLYFLKVRKIIPSIKIPINKNAVFAIRS
jgi:hypothetical protein